MDTLAARRGPAKPARSRCGGRRNDERRISTIWKPDALTLDSVKDAAEELGQLPKEVEA